MHTGVPVVRAAKPVCTFFAKGCCTKGDACAYAHEVAATAVAVPVVVAAPAAAVVSAAAAVPAAAREKSKKPCRNFFAGGCKFGERCTFSHEADAQLAPLCRFWVKEECSNTECRFRHEFTAAEEKEMLEDTVKEIEAEYATAYEAAALHLEESGGDTSDASIRNLALLFLADQNSGAVQPLESGGGSGDPVGGARRVGAEPGGEGVPHG
jgi:Torus domain/CCCH-type zinc finger/RNA-binding, Nab2-type zinc finger